VTDDAKIVKTGKVKLVILKSCVTAWRYKLQLYPAYLYAANIGVGVL